MRIVQATKKQRHKEKPNEACPLGWFRACSLNRNISVQPRTIEIAMDVYRLMDTRKTFIFLSGDGDFAPLVEMLKAHGCRVEVVSFRRSTAIELINAATQYTAIEESMLFKEKKFQKNEPYE